MILPPPPDLIAYYEHSPAPEPLKGAVRRVMHRARLRRVRDVSHFAKALRKGHFVPATELEILCFAKSTGR